MALCMSSSFEEGALASRRMKAYEKHRQLSERDPLITDVPPYEDDKDTDESETEWNFLTAYHDNDETAEFDLFCMPDPAGIEKAVAGVPYDLWQPNVVTLPLSHDILCLQYETSIYESKSFAFRGIPRDVDHQTGNKVFHARSTVAEANKDPCLGRPIPSYEKTRVPIQHRNVERVPIYAQRRASRAKIVGLFCAIAAITATAIGVPPRQNGLPMGEGPADPV